MLKTSSSLYSAVAPQRKRPRLYSSADALPSGRKSSILSNFDNALYDELILSIFSYLPYKDLCNIQSTNTNWSRLSLDNQVDIISACKFLWRSLYLREFGRSRLRGSRGYYPHETARPDGKHVKLLRAQTQSKMVTDWKWMFRISCNWRTGRSAAEEELKWQGCDDPDLPVHVVLAGGLMITASSLPSPTPQIMLHAPNQTPHSFSATSMPPNPFNKVTALALDQSQSAGTECRLVVFYSTGNFCLFLMSSWGLKETKEILSYVAIGRLHRMTPIVQAVYHHPLLITLSSSFDLTIYELPSHAETRCGPPQVRLTQTLTSFTSYPPTSLILSNPSPQVYKLVLAYSVPVYPSHWTVAVTELTISSFVVQSTQSASALDLAPGWSSGLSETMSEQHARKLSEVSSTSTDGKYVVLASATTNTIQLYRLSTRSRAAGPKLTFVRTLYGHVSPVQALHLADGRCVSLSRDGSLWVWDLEKGGVEVQPGGLTEVLASPKVLFDDRRILVAFNGRIIIRRFDV
ncbi:hypothetical protein K439DRAFT_1405823 [Ramaria rubella]|nr:hypothetical protein K439DRAFT_1405823 [Ramaria rubella]